MPKRLVALLIIGVSIIFAALVPFGRAERRAELRPGYARAVFAGGCFWCMEPPFEKLSGVVSVTSGYTGGRTDHPTYQQVSSGTTGHYEAVEVVYDSRLVSYRQLLDVYWRNVDPENPDGQFCDFGDQYRSAIFVEGSAQRAEAEKSREAMLARRRWIRFATEIQPAARFWVAESHHQDYYRRFPLSYRYYRFSCGRDERLRYLWK